MRVILQADQRQKQKHEDVFLPAHSQKTILIWERTWSDIEPQDYSPTNYSMLKKLINLLRHGSLPRDKNGAIEFLRMKDNLQKHFLYCHHWSDEKWNKKHGKRRRKQDKISVLY